MVSHRNFFYVNFGTIGDRPNPAETEAFVYDGEHIALVFDGEGNQTHRYLHGSQIDQVIAEETADGEVRWALTDHQGSVRDVIDNDGVLLNHITYDSFGNITSETDAEVSFRFSYTGREFDEELGQYFYRARYYDAAIGRFINEDTMGFAGGDVNLFRYVNNSPLNYIDPSGNYVESGWDLFSLGVGVTSFGYNVSQGNWRDAGLDAIGIGADATALLLPIPGGANAARNADKVGKVGKWFNELAWVGKGTRIAKNSTWVKYTIRGLQASNVGINGLQTFESAKRAYREWQCEGEIPWGALFETSLNGLATLGSIQTLNRSLRDLSPRGLRRRAFSQYWAPADLDNAINQFAGPNPVIRYEYRNNNAKKIYTNPNTGIELIEDLQGKYFRIENPSLPGSRRFLDLNGNVPNNKILSNGRQAGRTPSEYNEVTHFLIQ